MPLTTRREPTSLRARVEVGIPSARAFELVIEQLGDSLAGRGIQLEAGPEGRLLEGTEVIGRVVEWVPGVRVRIEWHPASWEPGLHTEIVLGFHPSARGTIIECEHRGWGAAFHGSEEELTGWFAGAVVGAMFQATAPQMFGDWITDRRARRPEGPEARTTYRDPIYHRPNFRALLEVLELTAQDRLFEVGCGGGAFLQEALKTGCRAAGVDHSPTMVRLARELNADAIAEGRLTVVEGEADALPFPSHAYTCAASTGVFAFFPDPVRALREIHRILAGHGRFVMYTASAALRGTPANPEPIASRTHAYTDAELIEMARAAGFDDVHVTHPDLGRYAREAGVPPEALPLFEGGEGGQLLTARVREKDPVDATSGRAGERRAP